MRSTVKIMNNFGELLKKDCQISYEYEDEHLVSTLRCTSLSYSLREEPNSSDFKNKNRWLFSEDDEAGKIKVINFDRVPDMCCCSGTNTCDAFFYDFNGKSRSYLIEFKNCSRDVLHKKYLNLKSDDCILRKITESAVLIENELEFDGKYTSSELVSDTHIIIVYNGKNNMPARCIPFESVKKKRSDGIETPRKPERVSFKKSVEDNVDRIGAEIVKTGFSVCFKDDFPVPGKPDFEKVKGTGKVRNYTLFTNTDFTELVRKDFFADWDWGAYSEFFS